MTRSAPIERTSAAFRPLATAVTCAPNRFASWTANVPTPPDAPMTSTLSPARISPASRRAWSAVVAASGTAAACSKVSVPGHRGEQGLGRDGVLGKSAELDEPEDAVADGEAGGALAGRDDLAGDVAAEDRVLRTPQAGGADPGDVREATHEMPVPGVGGRHPDADQDLARSRVRDRHVAEPEHVGRAERVLGNGVHRVGGDHGVRARRGGGAERCGDGGERRGAGASRRRDEAGVRGRDAGGKRHVAVSSWGWASGTEAGSMGSWGSRRVTEMSRRPASRTWRSSP